MFFQPTEKTAEKLKAEKLEELARKAVVPDTPPPQPTKSKPKKKTETSEEELSVAERVRQRAETRQYTGPKFGGGVDDIDPAEVDPDKVEYKDLKRKAEEVAKNLREQGLQPTFHPEYQKAFRNYEQAKMKYVRSKK